MEAGFCEAHDQSHEASPDGVRITAHDPEFADVMEAFEQTRRGYRNALKELAK